VERTARRGPDKKRQLYRELIAAAQATRAELQAAAPGLVAIGYGRIGREVAERAAGLKCRVLAANRSPVADPAPAETVFPLAELDRMLPLCDTVLISCGLAPRPKD